MFLHLYSQGSDLEEAVQQLMGNVPNDTTAAANLTRTDINGGDKVALEA